MSSINGSCSGPSQSELLIQQGLQRAQQAHQQQNEQGQLATQASFGTAGITASEPGKGINLDTYA